MLTAARVGQSSHGARHQKDVAEDREKRRRRETTDEHEDVDQRRLRFLGEKSDPTLKKPGQAVQQRDQIVEQAGVSRGIAEPHRFASHAAQSLPAENQPENEPDAERCKDRLRRIFADVLFAVFLKSADAVAGVFPSLLGFAFVFFRHCAGG